ncbi:hypothetical protein [Effusibacillus consociatus]
MQPSLRSFLEQLIDYAGLFPPASLPLEAAIHNFAAYRGSTDAWMLGRFIMPASRLAELDRYAPIFSAESPLACAVLGRKSENASACREGLRADLEQVAVFCNRHGEDVEVKVFELPLPPAPPERGLLETIATETGGLGLQTFCEVTVPFEDSWEQNMLTALDVIAAHNSAGEAVLGVKFRTGGVTAEAFPTPAQAAAVIVGCRDRRIELKFTAGLHHPIRMYRDEVGTRMHGFLNVFTAGMLAHVHNLDAAVTAEILADESPDSFSFTAEGLAWRDLTISVPEIARLRSTALRSYGSCSFDEPRDDLRGLRIL